MNLTAWRIVKRKHRASAFTGEGARRYGGRWNSKGVAIVYTSQSASLAVLEILVHLQAQDVLKAFVLAALSFDDSLVHDLPTSKLPANWREDPAPAALRTLGDAWVQRGSSVVLRVPSAIIESEYNYLINPAHPNFAQCAKIDPKPFRFDSRLLK